MERIGGGFGNFLDEHGITCGAVVRVIALENARKGRFLLVYLVRRTQELRLQASS